MRWAWRAKYKSIPDTRTASMAVDGLIKGRPASVARLYSITDCGRLPGALNMELAVDGIGRLSDGYDLQPAVDGIDLDCIAGDEVAGEEHLAELVLDAVLDDAAQWPGAEDRVVALVPEPVLAGIGDFQPHALGHQLALNLP